MMGLAALQLGDLDRASRTFDGSLERFQEHGDAWGSAHILNHLAFVSLRRGDYPQAAELAEEALALTRQTGDRHVTNIALHHLAQIAWASDEHERAARYFREALTIAWELADTVDSAYYMRGLAAVAEARGELRRASRLLGTAEALLEGTGLVTYAHASHELHQRVASAARERLGDQAWTVAHDEGRAMTFEEAVAYALGEDEA
jgi:non-specific serine/threonine protein kinase